jgi:cellulose synthase/poly-beta-1,6-N-acetylglucosamine synthase-like glycosyltransferase
MIQQTNMSTVAICIPTYNQAAYLERSVRSALAQTHPCEVWVSDDASTDETAEVMARQVAAFPQIRHFRQKANLGMSGNPRWIVKQPRCEFIVKLDSDDELHPTYVEELLGSLRTHPSAGYAHAAVQQINGGNGKERLRFLARKCGFQSGEESLRASIMGYRVAANICLFRRSALQQVDYYKPDLNFADDWDLAVRLADGGWGNVYVNKVLANYRVWDTPARIRRKLAEVEGCRRVIEESLVPAYARRGWSLAPIMKARHRLALGQAACLRLNQFTAADRDELQLALRRLDDSVALRWKFRWIRTPLARLVEVPSALASMARVWGKTTFYRPGQ